MALVTKPGAVWINNASEAHHRGSRQIPTAPRVGAVRAAGFTMPGDFRAELAPHHVAWIVAALTALICSEFAAIAMSWAAGGAGGPVLP
jgi:hypothetical protein